MSAEAAPGIPRGLREALLGEKLVLFVGSGLSQPAGAPDWRGLLKRLVRHCHDECITLDDEDELLTLVEGGSLDLLIAAGHLRAVLKEKMDDFVHETFSILKTTASHRTLAELKLAGIVTTNYDNLIEGSLRERGTDDIKVILPQDIFSLARLDENKPWVLKMHGTCEKPDRIVITAKDYEGQPSAPQSAMARLLQQYTFLFVGFGFADPDTLDLLSQLRLSFDGGGRRHYALVERTTVGRVRERFLLDFYQIQLLPYNKSAPDHPEVTLFLQELLEEQRRATDTEMSKVILVITRHGEWPNGEFEPLLLVTNTNPQWRTSLASGSPLEQQAYMLPSVVGDATLGNVVEIAAANLLGIAPEEIKLHFDDEIFSSRKFNPALRKNTKYQFTFAQVELKRPALHLEDPTMLLGGRCYEWLSPLTLRSHPATMELNQDVIVEINRRYGSELRLARLSVRSSLSVRADPYEYRARTYADLPWINDKELLEEIVGIALAANSKGVIDLGCGPGTLRATLREKSEIPYVGVDISAAMIGLARESAATDPLSRFAQMDLTADKPANAYDDWAFVVKNVLHLLHQLGPGIGSLAQRFGRPSVIIIVETVSPSIESLAWVQTLFELLGVQHKCNWFLKGQLPARYSLWGMNCLTVEYRDQFIDVDPWLSSFPLTPEQANQARKFVQSMPEIVAREMKYEHTSNSSPRLLRLQEIATLNCDGSRIGVRGEEKG